jgi:tetratricopeptide (TPR) repeat protein
MKLRACLLSFVLLLAFSAARADYGSSPPRMTPTPSAIPGGSDAPAELTPRQEAERCFAEAYDDVTKAGKDLENGRPDNATKKYRRALGRCRQAVELDTAFVEAWNLIGFTSRKLGDYPHSFAAYEVALRLNPDFALAHEYFGEGLLETGDLAGAKHHLEALRRLGASDLIAELQGAITKYESAHPVVAGTTPPADTHGGTVEK